MHCDASCEIIIIIPSQNCKFRDIRILRQGDIPLQFTGFFDILNKKFVPAYSMSGHVRTGRRLGIDAGGKETAAYRDGIF